ncbi:MAG: hypothetical protein COB36_10005 [Alphaproteobacteria bacterium]|nr:MAG: hypothetical protein COB36_10005 [Alphaproteobacteria bacterium]
MSKDKKKRTVSCKSCEQEVAKSANKCPHCGEVLKTSAGVKVLTVLAMIVAFYIFFVPSSDEVRQLNIQEELAALAQSEPSSLSPKGDLAETFNMLSENTDIQRDNLAERITGSTVQWNLPVYEVRKLSEGRYRVQSATTGSVVGTFINIYTRSPEEEAYVESLKLEDTISFKGKITGVRLRSVQIDPALLTN